MIIFPAIDLKNGECVRLVRGDMGQATVFNDDPAAQALTFERQGFTHLHVVDLDGAFAGKPMNVTAVERILETVGLCVQLGGGIRDMQTIEAWLEKGVNRVIIGTAAVRDPALVKDAAKKHPERIAVGLSAVVAVLDPPLVVLGGQIAQAGGVPLRDAVRAAMEANAPLETTVEITAVSDDPVLLGGLDSGLAAVREILLTSLRS